MSNDKVTPHTHLWTEDKLISGGGYTWYERKCMVCGKIQRNDGAGTSFYDNMEAGNDGGEKS
jgi:hypothetical protein